MEEKVSKVLFELGVPHHIKGYAYIKQAVLKILEDESFRENITKWLYPDVAKVYYTTSSRVERAIRHAIEKVFKNTNFEVLDKYFGNSIDVCKEKVSNKQFLITIADYILGY